MRLLYSLLLVCSGSFLFAQSSDQEYGTSVYFATASSQLDADALETIAQFQEELAAYADYTIRIEAFTDKRGEKDYNETLAANRAASVRKLLESKGTVTTGLEVISYGKRRAREDATSEQDLRQDRRVDLVATVTGWKDMDAVLTALRADQKQTFTTDADSSFVIRGNRGGRFLLDAGSLVDEAGNPARGPVTLSLTEAYTFDDILLAGLTTHSGDRTLETGGMFKLEAVDQNGKPLALADGKTIASSIPTDDLNEQMRIFSGTEHTAEDGGLDWELTSGGVVTSASLLVRTDVDAPVNVRWHVDVNRLMASWIKANPEPEMEAARTIPRLRPEAKYPDTASLVWTPPGLQKIFASQNKREAMRRQLIKKAEGQYNRDVRNRERSITMRRDNTLFNDGREDRFAEAQSAWEDGRAAEEKRLQLLYDGQNEALRKDYEKRRDAYRAKQKARLENALANGPDEAKAFALKRYFFNTTRLGWANCDIFYSEDDPVEVLARFDKTTKETTVILIPEGRRAVLAYRPGTDGNWHCNGIPRGKAYQLIAYQVRDGRIEFARERVAGASEDVRNFDFNPVGVAELKQILAEISPAK